MQGMLEAVMNRANQVGTIRTLLGRKCRFDLYEPNWYEPNKFYKGLPLKQAEAEYGNLDFNGLKEKLTSLEELETNIQENMRDRYLIPILLGIIIISITAIMVRNTIRDSEQNTINNK